MTMTKKTSVTILLTALILLMLPGIVGASELDAATAYANFAAIAPEDVQQAINNNPELQAAIAYAYLDLEAALVALEAKILTARAQIAFGSVRGWTTTPGKTFTGYFDSLTGEFTIVSETPGFDDLFPGWEPPINNPRTGEVISGRTIALPRRPLTALWQDAASNNLDAATAYANFAAIAPEEVQQAINNNPRAQAAIAYAYLDLDAALATLEAKILTARAQIVHNSVPGWTTLPGQSFTGYFDPVTDEFVIVSETPDFADLFPGWDPPYHGGGISQVTPFSSGITTTHNINLNRPPASGDTAAFFNQFFSFRGDIFAGATRLPVASSTFNIGFTNFRTGNSMAYHPHLPQGRVEPQWRLGAGFGKLMML